MAQRPGHGGAFAPPVVDAEIARIPAEQLVAAIARQGHRHVLARHARDQRGRDLRRVGEGLVVHVCQGRHHGQAVLGGDVELGMLGAQVRRHRLGVLGLVIALLVKADGEGAHRLRALRLHQGHDGGRVDAAGKKRAQADVRQHLAAHCLRHHLLQRVDRLRVGLEAAPVAQALVGRAARRPVHLGFGQLATAHLRRVDLDPGARRQLADAGVDRLRRGNVVVAHERG
ncbi:Uncharacterised protein [Bordetella pertussis]|nr:Uncharacterised protein [Bordetella pertussis]CFE03840.1 Uncharacterised protein [Bordetella pertussis]CFL88044.1 Uncharacterised protein [Bordetella pertussis]CFL97404.1 Uncharacterised protein [Bordetella pertussis]CFM00255.1 Uncharacterised protein [Bordetella pertussis]